MVLFGITEISGRDGVDHHDRPTLLRFADGWKYMARPGVGAAGWYWVSSARLRRRIVIGTAQFLTPCPSAATATFYRCFGLIFVGLGCGIGVRPLMVGRALAPRWSG